MADQNESEFKEEPSNNSTSSKVTLPTGIPNQLFSRVASIERQIQESNPYLTSADVRKMLSESIQKKIQQASQPATNSQVSSGELLLENTANRVSLPRKIEYWDLITDNPNDGDENTKRSWKLVKLEGIQRLSMIEKGTQFDFPDLNTAEKDANVSSETLAMTKRKRKARRLSKNVVTQPVEKKVKDEEEKAPKQLEHPQVNPIEPSIPPPILYSNQPMEKDSSPLEQEQVAAARHPILQRLIYDNQLAKEKSTPWEHDNPAAIRDAVPQPIFHSYQPYESGLISTDSTPGSYQFYHIPQVSARAYQISTPSQYRQPQPSLYEQHIQYLHQQRMQQQHMQYRQPQPSLYEQHIQYLHLQQMQQQHTQYQRTQHQQQNPSQTYSTTHHLIGQQVNAAATSTPHSQSLQVHQSGNQNSNSNLDLDLNYENGEGGMGGDI